MTTVSEEAVNTAEIIQVITDLRMAILQDDDEGLAEHAEPMAKAKALISKLAALPHLPGVGVKKLEWELVSGDYYAEGAGTHYNIYQTKPDLWNSVTVRPGNVRLATNVDLEAAKAAAQADYEARILSACEPSAARELALEEIIALCRDYSEDSQPDSEYRLACNDIIEAIQERRAISSPDHADAGKVEGDEKKWPMREIVAKAIAYHSVGDPHAKTIRGDQRWEWFLEEADNFISVFGCYLPPLPSAQSEGAE
ncbi:hypothetical protein [Brucella intermedia]